MIGNQFLEVPLYIIMPIKGNCQAGNAQYPKFFQKNFQKGLDKSLTFIYNK